MSLALYASSRSHQRVVCHRSSITVLALPGRALPSISPSPLVDYQNRSNNLPLPLGRLRDAVILVMPQDVYSIVLLRPHG